MSEPGTFLHLPTQERRPLVEARESALVLWQAYEAVITAKATVDQAQAKLSGIGHTGQYEPIDYYGEELNAYNEAINAFEDAVVNSVRQRLEDPA